MLCISASSAPASFYRVPRPRRKGVRCGAVQVAFVARKRLKSVQVEKFNTPRGTVQVSTAKATALDLAGYPRHAGGFDQVATILSELAEKIDGERLVAAAKTGPLPWAQRLGYLLELVYCNR
jgi:predicted transcriptional regulator of viral defense system